ncbi:MAG: DUF3817 domain-containing protein [Flavitalea sp.]
MNFTTNLGRLRIIGLLEGISLIVLVFIAVPLKYGLSNDQVTKMIGPVHGALFLLFVFNAVSVAIERRWEFRKITWKVLLACLVPFGTFYVDRKILRKM